MRVLLQAQMPVEPFNTLVRNGTAGQKLKQILEALKPEAAYFMDQSGRRCAMLIVNMNDPSEIPKLAEPFFMTFNAEIKINVVMTPEDLGRANLDNLGKQWG